MLYRADRGPADASVTARGAAAVAGRATTFAQQDLLVRPALINGTPGFVSSRDGEPVSVIAFTVAAGQIVEIDVLLDPDRLRRLDLSAL